MAVKVNEIIVGHAGYIVDYDAVRIVLLVRDGSGIMSLVNVVYVMSENR